jgi:hypothetical protein
MPTHPYRGLPADQFWSTAIRPIPVEDLDPLRTPPFTIAPTDQVATAGACFAQYLPRHLQAYGYHFLQTEPPATPTEPSLSARFGTITTTRQLSQLLLGAYGLHRPQNRVWRRNDGRFIDPLRPQLFPQGFATPEEAILERRRHHDAIRRLFEQCRVFVFTLSLTETWLAEDGTALPIPPGILDVDLPGQETTFENLSVAAMRQDMERFLADLFAVNPDVRVILTVSPIPIVATYEKRHVLLSNTASKSALRVLADETERAHASVFYFPAYEIITAPQSRGAYFEPDLRALTKAGMANTLRAFSRHMMRPAASAPAYAAVSEIRAEADQRESRQAP